MQPHVLGANALIVRDGQILLGHRTDRDLWNLPGGIVEPGEAPWEAATREAAEEVGVDATVVRLLGLGWQPGIDDLAFDFLCSTSGEPQPCHTETDDARWFPVDAVPDNLFAPQADRLAFYRKNGWTEAPLLWTTPTS